MPIWLPFQRVVAEKNLPLHRDDRLIGYTGCLSPSRPHILMVEALEPYRSIQLYVVSSGEQRETIKIILETDERTEGTWIAYTRFAWLGTHQLMHWLDRWIVTPWMQCVVSVRACIFFHRLYLVLERQQTALELAQESEAQRAARVEMEGERSFIRWPYNNP